MGLFDRFRPKKDLQEDVLYTRLKGTPSKNGAIGLSDDVDDITNEQMTTDHSLIDMNDIDEFTTLSRYLDDRYKAYEEMLRDPIIATALEMYADDATQMNRDGNIVWVESDDADIANAANRLLTVLGINKYAWKHIYGLCTYGDIFLKLFKDGDEDDVTADNNISAGVITIKPDDKTRRLEERIEYVYNPSTVFDIQSRDKTYGFIKLKSKPEQSTIMKLNNEFIGGFNQPVSVLSPDSFTVFNNKSYVHISLSESINRFPQLVVVKNEDGDISKAYQIKTGKSVLEDAYAPTRQLQLLENSLVLNRLTKSALLRILQIEVGDAPEPDVKRKIQRIKGLIEQKMSLNTVTGETRSYNSPGPVENVIYQATRDGKGAISEMSIGGDVNVRDIVDIEFFQNRQLAALKIPKQFLNFDSAEGFSNGTSLTKTSSRYAHTIMRIQNSYIQGITTLLNIFFLDKGLDYVNKFTVKMVNPSTIEQTERDEQLSTRIGQVDDLMRLFDDYGSDMKDKVFKVLINDFIQVPGLSDVVNETNADNSESLDDNNQADDNFDNRSADTDLTDETFSDIETIPDDVADDLADSVMDKI